MEEQEKAFQDQNDKLKRFYKIIDMKERTIRSLKQKNHF